MRRGALATSGTSKRSWIRGGELQHHLIDPRTGRARDLRPGRQVTACGATCLAADVAAKAGFLLGRTAPSWLDARGIPARFVDRRRSATVNDPWQRSMREAAACI